MGRLKEQPGELSGGRNIVALLIWSFAKDQINKATINFLSGNFFCTLSILLSYIGLDKNQT